MGNLIGMEDSSSSVTPLWAHSRNLSGRRHTLEEHLRGSAVLARQFATAFDAGELAEYLALVHDVGKGSCSWQHGLHAAEARGRKVGIPHKEAGAWLAASQAGRPIAAVVQSHHGGLPGYQDLQTLIDSVKARTHKDRWWGSDPGPGSWRATISMARGPSTPTTSPEDWSRDSDSGSLRRLRTGRSRDRPTQEVNQLADFINQRAFDRVQVMGENLRSSPGDLLRSAAYAHGAVDTAIAAGRVDLAAEHVRFLVEQAQEWADHPEYPADTPAALIREAGGTLLCPEPATPLLPATAAPRAAARRPAARGGSPRKITLVQAERLFREMGLAVGCDDQAGFTFRAVGGRMGNLSVKAAHRIDVEYQVEGGYTLMRGDVEGNSDVVEQFRWAVEKAPGYGYTITWEPGSSRMELTRSADAPGGGDGR
ncbi:hypothetical protein GCM10010430_55870 [Kitasatospora cystarginea]|uniref:HD Cas3-type domain-containing protein n=2 Tax=Kitasatospora cystarginea TaxID=58350 RepID=A0ABN3END4_9ACTN